MKKIKTIFERNWEGNRGVVNKLSVDFDFANAIATEKVDGTNVRLTVRNHILIRVEKRRNPSKLEKAKGIIEPWYVDADEFSPEDKYIYEGARATDLSQIEDGEWSGEAIGEKIQGNPLKIKGHRVMLFSHPETVRKYMTFTINPPIEFNELKEWMKNQRSLINSEVGIEGIVWHHPNGDMVKIKQKDFK